MNNSEILEYAGEISEVGHQLKGDGEYIILRPEEQHTEMLLDVIATAISVLQSISVAIECDA